jgi:phosphate transport system permease protein
MTMSVKMETNEALAAALTGRTRMRVLGLTFDDVMRVFFGGNATVALVVLALILIFLGREGLDFFQQNQVNLRVYRQAGLEYVDLMRRPMEEFTALNRRFNDLRLAEFQRLLASGVDEEKASELLTVWDTFGSQLSSGAGDARGLISDLTEAFGGGEASGGGGGGRAGGSI